MPQTGVERRRNLVYNHPTSVVARAVARVEPGSSPDAILARKHMAELAELGERHHRASVALTHEQERAWQDKQRKHRISLTTRPHQTEVAEKPQVDHMRAEHAAERAATKARHRAEGDKLAAAIPAP